MSGLGEVAAVMLSAGQARIDVTARNVSNINTPGFRTQRLFQQAIDLRSATPLMEVTTPRRAGPPAFKHTGNPLDIALSGAATMLLRDGEQLVATSSARLHRDAQGLLVDGQGRVLQATGGGDIAIGSGRAIILNDGIVLVDDRPEARVGMFAADGHFRSSGSKGVSTALTFPDTSDDGVLHQGMLIASDVDLASEMVELTYASRAVETGAKLFEIYDDLLGKATAQLGDPGQ